MTTAGQANRPPQSPHYTQKYGKYSFSRNVTQNLYVPNFVFNIKVLGQFARKRIFSIFLGHNLVFVENLYVKP